MTEPEPGLEEVERELDARGVLLKLDEVGSGEWRASAEPKGLPSRTRSRR